MALYDGVAAVAREVSKKYDGVNAVAREVPAAYDGVNGVAREYFKSGTPIGDLAVGSTVYMNVNGVSTAFIVVHQGIPSTSYASSCNGTWLMMKNCYTSGMYGRNNKYSSSSVHSYLNSTFFNLLDSGIQNTISNVSIPSNNSNLSTKVFLLSAHEIDSTHSYMPTEGSALSYFKGASDTKRIAYYGGSAVEWWSRTRNTNINTSVTTFSQYGALNNTNSTYTMVYIRPALIVPAKTLVDSSNRLMAA